MQTKVYAAICFEALAAVLMVCANDWSHVQLQTLQAKVLQA